jgi:hypothetical protein
MPPQPGGDQGVELHVKLDKKRKKARELGLARLYVIETNSMTPDMIVLGL